MIEDTLLAFAVLCLCATTVLSYLAVDYLYDALDVILLKGGQDLGKLLAEVPKMTRISEAAACLWWMVIFPVKLAYLFFFRRLIVHLRALYIWWWCVFVFTVCYIPRGKHPTRTLLSPSMTLNQTNRYRLPWLALF